MKLKKNLFANLIIISCLCSCTNAQSLLPTRVNSVDNLNGIQNKNDFDPSSGGAIDPRPITDPKIIIEGNKGKMIFNNGENNLTLHLTLKPSADIQGPITPLTGLKLIKGEFYIGKLKIPVEIDATKIDSGLDYSFELTGLGDNTQVILKTNVIDKNNEIMGTNEYYKTITERNDSSQLNVEISKWW